MLQKFASDGASVEQTGQVWISEFPQLEQNLASVRFPLPQLPQVRVGEVDVTRETYSGRRLFGSADQSVPGSVVVMRASMGAAPIPDR